MPEIVDVSMPSSRSRLASKSSFQASFGSRARTFTSNQFTSPPAGEVASSLPTVWGGCAKRRWGSAGGGLELGFPREVQNLLRCVVWRALGEQTRSQSRVVNQGMAHPIARDLGRRLGSLVLEPLLGEVTALPARFQVMPVGEHSLPEALDALLLRGDRGEDRRLPTTLWRQAQH